VGRIFTALNRLQARTDVVVGIGGVSPGVYRRRVEKDHFSNAAASAWSWFSETGDNRPCFDRPAPTDEN
jgi:hypothetical protein